MGLDVHKRSVFLTDLNEDGSVNEQYDFANNEKQWNEFKDHYLSLRPEIALEISTSGKYVARKLRDLGFSVHLADQEQMAEIYKTAKKNDREDSYKLAKRLRMHELPEVHLPSTESDALRSVVRYRRSIGQDITIVKNRIHGILTAYGIIIDKSDIFGVKGIRAIRDNLQLLREADRIVLSDLLSRLTDLIQRADQIEDEMSRAVENNEDIRLLMTIPGINVYSATAIMSEIDDISRFRRKESLAAYAGLIPRLDESSNRRILGHISKHGPSLLRFALVNCAHTVIKYSRKFRSKYNSLVKRLGRNRSIVAIARILAETIHTMLVNRKRFIDEIDSLTERKMKAMSARARKSAPDTDTEMKLKVLREEGIRHMSD